MTMFKRLVQHLFILIIAISTATCSDNDNRERTTATDASTPPMLQTDGDLCPLGDAVEVDGVRRLALIVGVGVYRDEDIPDLLGPPNDAKQVYDLLTDDNSYQFPKQNVCLLLNERADKAGFKAAFELGLVRRARENDLAVIYFAGHGSQARDQNQDEPDNRDETLMLHDASSTDSSHDLIDDELHLMLSKLDSKTHNITLILDSCNSGSAQRNANAGTYTARFFNRVLTTEAPTATEPGDSSGDAGAEMTSKDLPGLIAVTAARDGTAALEIDGRGIFTNALVGALSAGSNEPPTWAQLARMVPIAVSSESNQIPSFQGDLERHVFGIAHGLRPVAWEVVKVGEKLTLGGPPLPGYTKGSELRIYAGNAKDTDLHDPGKAKATVILEQTTGLTALARVTSAAAGSPAPEPGDTALLARPGDQYTRIKVRLRPADEAGGIPAERAASIRASIERHPEASMLTQLTQGPGDFELSLGERDRVLLRGPENTTRIRYENDSAIAKNLWQHARQRALLHLKGEGGSDFTDNYSLQVQLIPAEKQDVCADGDWVQAPPNEEQIIPLCHKFNIQVSLSEDTNLGMLDHNTPAGVQVGGVILSTDGSILGFPVDGRAVRIAPGETAKFDLQGETFRGIPPLDVQDRIIVFGTRETNPVQWHRLTETAKTRSKGIASQNALFRALHNYLQPGARGIGQTVVSDESNVESDTWTLTSLTMRVEANSSFLEATSGRPTNNREYTINNFDIRPYLPDNRSTALYKVLRQAHRLTTRSAGRDGYPYKQHDWSLPTDEANLEKGIDCSRAIWFVFTRAGVPYNSDGRYLSTAMMTGDGSKMSEKFQRCDNSDGYRIGDILVYRDEEREKPDGHVVMVIDPGKRIAWGSHGWDGNEGDRGVEYQLIKIKKDWQRWDRKTMRRKACWRHQQFSAQASTTRGLPGISALSTACSPEKQCGLIP
jgi:hypothetical protein